MLFGAVFLATGNVAPAQLAATQPARSVATSYERAMFVLNLNPVAWEQVREDAVVIAAQLRRSNPGAADELMAAVDHLVAASAIPPPAVPDDDLPINPEEAEEGDRIPRAEAARQAFEQLTRAVGAILIQKLQVVASEGRAKGVVALGDARDSFAAFETSLRTVDKPACDRLNHCFEELDKLLNSSAAESSADTQRRLGEQCDAIAEYVSKNFGPGFRASSNRPLAPWPLASPTCDLDATLPILLPPGSRIAKSLPRPRQRLNSVERGALERETPLISLGAAAFNNPFIFGEPARTLGISCNSCHNKSGINSNFFIPGLSARAGGVDVTGSYFAPHANNAVFDPLDVPDLRGIRFTAPYGRNGRFASLRDFVRNVIVNEFNGREPDPILVDSMVAYMNEFDFIQNPALNRDGSLNHRASEEARRGEQLFSKPFGQFGNKSCASCHIPSANFVDHQRHDIGTVGGPDDFSRDRALDTPTLLGTVFSPPYFHDGSQPTLRAVVEWFEREYKLGLTPQEQSDLIAYVYTVGNGIHAFEVGDYFLAEDMEDQESFLAAFEFLAEKDKWPVIVELFRGIGEEIRHQSESLGSSALVPALDRLADLMEDAAMAAAANKHEAAKSAVRQWREHYAKKKYDIEYAPRPAGAPGSLAR